MPLLGSVPGVDAGRVGFGVCDPQLALAAAITARAWLDCSPPPLLALLCPQRTAVAEAAAAQAAAEATAHAAALAGAEEAAEVAAWAASRAKDLAAGGYVGRAKRGEARGARARSALPVSRGGPRPDPPPRPDDAVDEDHGLPQRMLFSMIETGAWTNLKAPVEELFIHAAYLVVPHVLKAPAPEPPQPSPAALAAAAYPSKKSAKKRQMEAAAAAAEAAARRNQAVVTEMGHAAFRAHVKVRTTHLSFLPCLCVPFVMPITHF
jgi:hypothetical protein